MHVLSIIMTATAVGLAIALIVTLSQAKSSRAELRAALNLDSASDSRVAAQASDLMMRLQTTTQTLTRLEEAIENAPLGIVVSDKSGNTVFTNSVADGYTSGREGDAVIGLRLRQALQESQTTQQPVQHKIEVYTPSPRTVVVSAFPLGNHAHDGGCVAFVDDRTQTSQADAMRKDFVANASHELKTPLGALRLLAEALVATESAETRASLSDRIQAQSTRMTRLVDDILDLSLVEETRPELQTVDVCAVVEESVQQVSLAAETLNIPILTQCIPVAINGDPRRLVSALSNLIENAVHYTSAKAADAPEPVIVRTSTSDGTVVIEVVDHGIGIAERHQSRIFERFYRVDRGRSRTSGGTGLGLAIARHVVQSHGGEIEIESVPGAGSTFRMKLPTIRST